MNVQPSQVSVLVGVVRQYFHNLWKIWDYEMFSQLLYIRCWLSDIVNVPVSKAVTVMITLLTFSVKSPQTTDSTENVHTCSKLTLFNIVQLTDVSYVIPGHTPQFTAVIL